MLSIFIAIAIALVVIALALVVWPLVKKDYDDGLSRRTNTRKRVPKLRLACWKSPRTRKMPCR